MPRSHSASSISPTSLDSSGAPTATIPALLTRMSSRPPCRRQNLGDERERHVRVHQVADVAGRLDALGDELRDAIVDPVRRRRDRDARPAATQRPRGREADPGRAAGAGDEGDPSSVDAPSGAAYGTVSPRGAGAPA